MKRPDGFATLAFGLAVVIMVLPTEADILAVLFRQREIMLAGVVAALCSVTELIPVVLSWDRQRSHPEAWRGRGYLIAATVILVINSLLFGYAFIGELFR